MHAGERKTHSPTSLGSHRTILHCVFIVLASRCCILPSLFSDLTQLEIMSSYSDMFISSIATLCLTGFSTIQPEHSVLFYLSPCLMKTFVDPLVTR